MRNSIQNNDLIAVVRYAKVRPAMYPDVLQVTDVDDRQDFSIQGSGLIDKLLSADKYSEEQKVTRTRMAEVLSKSYNTPFTIVFKKQDGMGRVLRGRLIDSEPLMGRVKVEDLDIADRGERFRLVDNRTLEELIVGGVKYTLKK